MMKVKNIHEFRASTLAEMLVVIVVAGVLFIALFDGVDIVRRYTNRLSQRLSTGNSLLDSFQQMDYLFQASDSVLLAGDVFRFYRDGEEYVAGEVRDSLWLNTRESGVDTLFRGVGKITIIPEVGYPSRVDSLGIRFRDRGKELYFLFGTGNRAEEAWEKCAGEVEEPFKKEYDDDME